MVSPVEVCNCLLWLRDDGIVHAKWGPHVQIGLEEARKVIHAISVMCGGKVTPALVDVTQVTAIDRQARLYFAGEETAKVEAAAALLIGSPLTRAIGNFFMGLNKPLIPTRLFTSETEALAWLKGFVR
jgi:hypothetical protein